MEHIFCPKMVPLGLLCITGNNIFLSLPINTWLSIYADKYKCILRGSCNAA